MEAAETACWDLANIWLGKTEEKCSEINNHSCLFVPYLFYDKNYLSLALSLRFLDEFVKKFLFFGICRGRITTPVPGAAR
jgi:hypothetical protein